MFSPEQFLIEKQRPLLQRLRLRVVPRGALVFREVAQRGGDFAMGWTKMFFGDRECILPRVNGLGIFPLARTVVGIGGQFLQSEFLGLRWKDCKKNTSVARSTVSSSRRPCAGRQQAVFIHRNSVHLASGRSTSVPRA